MAFRMIMYVGVAIIHGFIFLSTVLYGLQTPQQRTLDAAIKRLKSIEQTVLPLLSETKAQQFHVLTPTPQTLAMLSIAIKSFDETFYQMTLKQVAQTIHSHAISLDGIIHDLLTDCHLPHTVLNKTVLTLVFLLEVANAIKTIQSKPSPEIYTQAAGTTTKSIKKQYDTFARTFFSTLQKKQEALTAKKAAHKKWLLLTLLLVTCWGGYKLYRYFVSIGNKGASSSTFRTEGIHTFSERQAKHTSQPAFAPGASPFTKPFDLSSDAELRTKGMVPVVVRQAPLADITRGMNVSTPHPLKKYAAGKSLMGDEGVGRSA